MPFDAESEIEKVLSGISEEVKTVVAEVLSIEKNYIHMTSPRGVNDDIREMIERVVK